MDGATIQVSYDILNSNLSDKYNIRLEITQVDGKEITAASLKGDVGQNISGGNGKEIRWDLQADSIFLNANINFTIFAKLIPPEKTVATEASNVVTNNENIAEEKEKNILEDKDETEVLVKRLERKKLQQTIQRTPV